MGTAPDIIQKGRRGRGRRLARAFTLVEILIVVVILGILAMVVIPKFSNAAHQARENTLKDDLRYLRTQIQVYKAQHNDVLPGADGDPATFLDQMIKYTDGHGSTSTTHSSTYRFGPYLSQMPKNPLTGSATIEIAGASETAISKATTADGGWVYKPNTGEIIADMTGSDNNGTAYTSY